MEAGAGRLAKEERPWASRGGSGSTSSVPSSVVVPIYCAVVDLLGALATGPRADGGDGGHLSYVWILLGHPDPPQRRRSLTFRNAVRIWSMHGPIPEPGCASGSSPAATNVEAVLKTVHSVQVEMARSPLFPYCVELVTDQVLPVADGGVVPPSSCRTSTRPPSGTKFKARALHYALEPRRSPTPPGSSIWTRRPHLTPSVVRGIRSAIVEEEASGALRIGQGVVLYHRDLAEHPFLTLADSVRRVTP